MNYDYKQYFHQILEKYRLGNATPEEISFLEKYYELYETNEDHIQDENAHLDLKDAIKNSVDQKIQLYQAQGKKSVFKQIWFRYAAAASVALLLSITGYLLVNRSGKDTLTANLQHDVAPGSNKAILKLSNGTTIALDDAASGEISKQSGLSITKTADGQVVYTMQDHSAATDDLQEPVRNTISTPNGGKYTIILSDGTKVMLNAASSLTFPSRFSGAERIVELLGEAYFEVSKNENMRFMVKSGIQTVEVLGTHFNVNAYTDEHSIKTTLLEGAVTVLSGAHSTTIAPGEQAIVSRSDSKSITKRSVNPDKEVAWINGTFSFENDDLTSVMRQISRWYDVEVIYSDDLSEEKYFGEISRKSNLSEVFKILELNNVRFEIKGKTVKVSFAPGGAANKLK